MKKKLELEAGRKYRGYGLVNEYGEFEFTPEQTGSRAGNRKIIKETENYVLSTTKNKVIVHVTLDKMKSLALCQSLLTVVNCILSDLRNYEI